MKTYLTIILILASTMMCMADDVVRLRNGSVIKGTIKEYMITGDSVKISTETGTMNLRLSDVGSMSIKGETLEFADHKPAAKKKYRWSAEAFAGGTFDEDGIISANFGILTTHGVELNPHFFVGGGTGFVILDYDMVCFFPFYGEVRTNLGGKKISFTAGLRAGGEYLAYSRNARFTYYVHLDAGIRFFLSKHLSMSIAPYVESYAFWGAFGVRLAVGTF